jgi:hypothetical protein
MRLLDRVLLVMLAGCSTGQSQPPSPAPATPVAPAPAAVAAPAPAPTPAQAPAPAPAPKPDPAPATAPSGAGGAEAVKTYVQQKYADVQGAIAKEPTNEIGAVVPGVEAFHFSAGGMYPLVTMGPHVRRIIAVREKNHEIAFDFDQTVKDPDAPAALNAVLPAATSTNLEQMAGAILTLVPLDPFFKNPDPAFKVKRQGRRSTASMIAPNYKYEITFGPDGKVAALAREDKRPKPICSEHRARAQALLDAAHKGLRAGDVVWDDLTARLVADHYVYVVVDESGHAAGLASVVKGPGTARFAPAGDAAALRAMVHDVLAPVHDATDAGNAAQVALTLLARARALPNLPSGAPFFTVAQRGSALLARSTELGTSVRFGADGKLLP